MTRPGAIALGTYASPEIPGTMIPMANAKTLATIRRRNAMKGLPKLSPVVANFTHE